MKLPMGKLTWSYGKSFKFFFWSLKKGHRNTLSQKYVYIYYWQGHQKCPKCLLLYTKMSVPDLGSVSFEKSANELGTTAYFSIEKYHSLDSRHRYYSFLLPKKPFCWVTGQFLSLSLDFFKKRPVFKRQVYWSRRLFSCTLSVCIGRWMTSSVNFTLLGLLKTEFMCLYYRNSVKTACGLVLLS